MPQAENWTAFSTSPPTHPRRSTTRNSLQTTERSKCTTYTYDTYGRLSTVENPFSEVTTLTYDTAGRVSKKTFDSGVYDEYTYDTRSRVTDIDTKNSSHTALAERSYTYNAISQVTQLVEGTVTTTYTYDDIGQLTGESKTSGYTASYTYDANGNRATRTVNSVTETYSYDAGDKLTAITGGADPRTFGYDSAGRTTSISRSGGSDVTTLAYDYESRLTSISRSGYTTNTYSYNGFDTRISKVDSTGTSTYMRDGVGVTAPVLSDGYANYTPGVSEYRSSTSTFFHSALKNTDIQTGISEAITATQTYDAFGNVASSTGTFNSQFGYAGIFGYQADTDYDLKLVGHRYYDAQAGRFITRDPVKDGRNWYTYCSNRPIVLADPSGLQAVAWWDFEFTAEGVGEGFITGLHGAASGLSLGLYDGGSHKDDIGFQGSQFLGFVGAVSFAVAGGAAFVEGYVGAGAGAGAAAGGGGTVASDVVVAGEGIYVLRDPISGIIRYVGQTNNFARRFAEHMRDSTKNGLTFERWGDDISDPIERLVREQELIDFFGGVNGGQLLNKRNALGVDNVFRALL